MAKRKRPTKRGATRRPRVQSVSRAQVEIAYNMLSELIGKVDTVRKSMDLDGFTGTLEVDGAATMTELITLGSSWAGKVDSVFTAFRANRDLPKARERRAIGRDGEQPTESPSTEQP